jgi:hypothetical protein
MYLHALVFALPARKGLRPIGPGRQETPARQLMPPYTEELRTMISFGQSYSLPPRQVASTSKHKKLSHVSCADRKRASYAVGTSSSGVGVAVRSRSERASPAE